jgi:hypothetical protein
MPLCAPPLQTAEYPVALTSIHKVIRRLNRDTTLVATGLLGTVVFAAIVLAFPKRDPKADDLTKEARQTTTGSVRKSVSEITSGPATNFDDGFGPEISHSDPHANARSWSPAHRQDSARVIRPKIRNVRSRSSLWARLVDVKMRLVAFWHQRLAPTERSRGWTQFSNKGERKKASYTAKTSH